MGLLVPAFGPFIVENVDPVASINTSPIKR